MWKEFFFLRSSMEPVVNFCYLSEPQPRLAPSPSLPFEQGHLASGDVAFSFFCVTAASGTKKNSYRDANCYILVQENDRAVCFGRLTQLFLFFPSPCLVRLCLHSYHDSPPRCRSRGRHVPRAPCAGRSGEIWRKREQESKVVQARRDRGDDYQGFK